MVVLKVRNDYQSDQEFREWYKTNLKSHLYEISGRTIKSDVAEHISTEYSKSINVNDPVLMHKDTRAIARDMVSALKKENFVKT